MYGHDDVVDFLLEHGADFRDAADTGATGLHWAAGGGHIGIVKRLLELESPLEEMNRWGGSVLEHAGYGFEHENSKVDFILALAALLRAGAKMGALAGMDWEIEEPAQPPRKHALRKSSVVTEQQHDLEIILNCCHQAESLIQAWQPSITGSI